MGVKHQARRAADRLASAVFTERLPTYFHGKIIWQARDCWTSTYDRYEPHMAHAIKASLPRGGVFWDVGANIGVLSLFAATIAKSVIAFEPAPEVLALLRKNAANKKIEILPYGIGNADEDRFFAAQGLGSSSSFIEAVTAINRLCLPDEPITQVPATLRKLDTILADHAPPSLIKIDIEGFEFEALKGAQKLLSSHRPTLLIEIHPELLELSEGSETELFDLLKTHGYSWREISRLPNTVYTILAQSKV